MSTKIYSQQSLAAFTRRYERATTWTQARANNLGKAMLDQNVSDWQVRKLGTFRKLVEHLISDYEHYVANERPIIHKLGGSNIWVNSDAAQYAITVLERIRAGEGKNVHNFL